MDRDRFIAMRPFLYHITDARNLPQILNDRMLYSTEYLVEQSDMEDKAEFLETQRIGHKTVTMGGIERQIRDQDPLNRNITMKNMQGGWTFGRFALQAL
jgi:hypothetical protein